MSKITGIILVAGNSTRYGKNINKNLLLLKNKPVFIYSVEKFNSNKKINDIVIVCKESELDTIKIIIKDYVFKKRISFVIGGSTRKESVYNAIKSIDSDIVVIHDGARPLIKEEYIDSCISCMKKYKGCTVAIKSRDTVKISNDEGVVISTTKRNNTWLIQTPQAFDREVLLKVHEKYSDSEVTDDCELLEKDHYDVKLIEGDFRNIKVTFDGDLKVLESYL